MPNGIQRNLGRILEVTGNWLKRTGKRLSEPNGHSDEIDTRLETLNKFWFLMDNPLYIDDKQVDKIFDAIFRPEWEATSRTTKSGWTSTSGFETGIDVSAEASVPSIFKFGISGSTSTSDTESRSGGQDIIELKVDSPERKLGHLVNLYARHYPERGLWVDSNLVELRNLTTESASFDWGTSENLLETPAIRPLIFFDIGPGTKLLPMFGELTNGVPLPFYEDYLESLDEKLREKVPLYPGDGGSQSQVQEYWSAFESVFDSGKAIRVIEKSGRCEENSRIEWIDYRVVGYPEGGGAIPIHLHLYPRGRYPLGTFAYQTVRRGFKFGLRLIGTLKKGYDVNVLAVFER